MSNTSGRLPNRFLKLIEPILIKNENIQCSFRESFRWETFFRKWIVLTNFRLLICTRTLFGADSQEFHLREMDVERVRDNFGPYDSLIFRSKGEILYQVAIFRTRRKEAEEFLREITKHIAERDLYIAFPNTGSDSVTSFPSATPNSTFSTVNNLTPNTVNNSIPNTINNPTPNTVNNSAPNTVNNSIPNVVNNSVGTLTPEDLAECAEELEHDKDLKEMGVITEKEYREEKAKPCKKKAKNVTKTPYVRQKR